MRNGSDKWIVFDENFGGGEWESNPPRAAAAPRQI